MSVNDKMTAIADAIRAKNGTTEALTLDGMAEAVSELTTEELIQHADIPEYVKNEVLEVANKVQAVRQSDSIVFLAMSDTHHYGQQAGKDSYTDQDGVQTTASNTHAAMAAKALAYGLKFDFMAHLGDISWGHKLTTPELLRTQIEDLSDLLNEANTGIPCFRAIGNHDSGIYYHDEHGKYDASGVYTLPGSYLYEHFTAYSESADTVVSGQENGGYCYRDFTNKKLRVFLLNTSEALVARQVDNCMFGSQHLWFANALLNLNSKSDAAAWSFIVLSHYPADYGGNMPLSELLKAYVEGGSVSIAMENGGSSSVSFAGKNGAKMVAQFHGHVHNFIASKLYSYASGSGAKFDAWRVCVPNGQFNRENYYSTVGNYTAHSYAEDTSYGKTANSANDTSFVVNVVNPSEQKIYSFCYGAGYDRVIGYAATVYYSITRNLSNATISNAATSVEEGEAYSATITAADGYELSSVSVKMGGADITATAYADGVINIAAVTGNVTITAVAVEVLSVTNLLPTSTDASGSVYNGCGYKANTYLSGGAEGGRDGVYCSGFIAAKKGDVIRFKNVTMTHGQSNHRISLYNASKTHIADGTFNMTASQAPSKFTMTYDGSNNVTSITMTASPYCNDMAFFRFCCGYLGPDSIVTVNEEIE